MAHRVFEIKPKDAQTEEVTFALAGQSFACYPEPPLGVRLDLIRAEQRIDTLPERGRNAERIIAWDDFVRGALLPESRHRWVALLREPAFLTENADLIADIYVWLVEVYSARPTQSPNGSSVGQPSTGATSEGAASSPESATTG